MKPLTSPGEGPFVAISEIPDGATLMGMAPIGIRWSGLKKRGVIVPDGDCPAAEFAITHAMVNGAWHEVLGCGRATHVTGTNGGTMPCGSMLTQLGVTAPYYCARCTSLGAKSPHD